MDDFVYAPLDHIKKQHRQSYIPASQPRGTPPNYRASQYRGFQPESVARNLPADSPQKQWSYFLPYQQTNPQQVAAARPMNEWGSPAAKTQFQKDRETLSESAFSKKYPNAIPTYQVAARMRNRGEQVPLAYQPKGITMPEAAAAYSTGYGAPAPSVKGGYLQTGGVMQPLETLNPATQSAYDPYYTPPSTGRASRILSTLGMISNLASYVGSKAGITARQNNGGLPPKYWPFGE